MIIQLWCFIWGHKTQGKDFNHPAGDDYYYIRNLSCCPRCGKEIKR